MVYVFRLARMSNLWPRAHKIARSKSGTHVFDCCHGTEKKRESKIKSGNETFLKGPMICTSSSPCCFPADPGRPAQHTACRAICLPSQEVALSSQLASTAGIKEQRDVETGLL